MSISEAYKLFPHLPSGSIDWHCGLVNILIGQDHAALLPSGREGKDRVDNLGVLRTNLGSGWVLSGHHPHLPAPGVVFPSKANLLRRGSAQAPPLPKVRVNFISCLYMNPENLNNEKIADKTKVALENKMSLKQMTAGNIHHKKCFLCHQPLSSFSRAANHQYRPTEPGENGSQLMVISTLCSGNREASKYCFHPTHPSTENRI